MVITLQAPKSIVVVEEKTATLATLTIERVVEFPKEKIVKAFFKELPNNPIVIWEGASYDAIGQWTDSDLQARVLEIFA